MFVHRLSRCKPLRLINMGQCLCTGPYPGGPRQHTVKTVCHRGPEKWALKSAKNDAKKRPFSQITRFTTDLAICLLHLRTPTTVSIDDDLSSNQAIIALWTANDELEVCVQVFTVQAQSRQSISPCAHSTAVSIDDNHSSSQASITLWTANELEVHVQVFGVFGFVAVLHTMSMSTKWSRATLSA